MSKKPKLPGVEGPITDLMEEYIRLKALAGRASDDAALSLRYMGRFLESRHNGREAAVSRDDYEAWIDLSSSRKGRECRFSAIEGFCGFLRERGYPAFRGEARTYVFGTEFEARILTDEELGRLFDAADSLEFSSRCKYNHPLMFPVLLRLLYGCGLRLGEAIRLKNEDIDLDTGEIRIWLSKNGNSRVVHASDSLLSVIGEYMPRLNAYIGEGHLFRAYDGRPYGKAACESVMRTVRENAGLSGNGQQEVRFHDLRHNYAIRAMEKMEAEGMDLYVCLPLLTLYMGHGSIRETEYYIRLSKHGFHRVTEKASAASESIFPILGEE